MAELYGWVRNITCYLIFMTVITNILPNKKYEKYIRLFAGMVLILIVLKPLTSGLRLDDQIAYFFESITFQSQAEDFKKELAGMEDQRLGTMVKQYETAVQMDVEKMAEGEGLSARRVKAVIESDRNSERFGTVTSILVVLGSGSAGEEYDRSIFDMEPVEPVKPIEPVKIGSGEPKAANPEGAAGGEAGREDTDRGEVKRKGTAEGEAGDADRGDVDRKGAAPGEQGAGQGAAEQEQQAASGAAAAESAAVRAFRQKLVQYYNLEAQDVEIQLENG